MRFGLTSSAHQTAASPPTRVGRFTAGGGTEAAPESERPDREPAAAGMFHKAPIIRRVGEQQQDAGGGLHRPENLNSAPEELPTEPMGPETLRPTPKVPTKRRKAKVGDATVMSFPVWNLYFCWKSSKVYRLRCGRWKPKIGGGSEPDRSRTEPAGQKR